MALTPEEAVSVCSSNDADDTQRSTLMEQQANTSPEPTAKKRRKVRDSATAHVELEPTEEPPQQAKKPKKPTKKGTKLLTKRAKKCQVVRTEQKEHDDAHYYADAEE